jgi:hypothetical protein
MTAGLLSGLAVATVLLSVAVGAILHGRSMTREAAITVANLRRALRSAYDDTLRESLPEDLSNLLGRLTSHRPRPASRAVRSPTIVN